MPRLILVLVLYKHEGGPRRRAPRRGAREARGMRLWFVPRLILVLVMCKHEGALASACTTERLYTAGGTGCLRIGPGPRLGPGQSRLLLGGWQLPMPFGFGRPNGVPVGCLDPAAGPMRR